VRADIDRTCERHDPDRDLAVPRRARKDHVDEIARRVLQLGDRRAGHGARVVEHERHLDGAVATHDFRAGAERHVLDAEYGHQGRGMPAARRNGDLAGLWIHLQIGDGKLRAFRHVRLEECLRRCGTRLVLIGPAETMRCCQRRGIDRPLHARVLDFDASIIDGDGRGERDDRKTDGEDDDGGAALVGGETPHEGAQAPARRRAGPFPVNIPHHPPPCPHTRRTIGGRGLRLRKTNANKFMQFHLACERVNFGGSKQPGIKQERH